MKKLLFILALMLPNAVLAAGGSVHLDTANYDLTDKASLQNGAKVFMNYCLGCHQMQLGYSHGIRPGKFAIYW
jgi:ubiquinol-cytochrome c reductase cytochrome c1 subunit